MCSSCYCTYCDWQLLEEAQNQHGSAFAVSLCESLLERQRDVLFVIDFMLRQLRDSLDHNRQVELHVQRIGYTVGCYVRACVHVELIKVFFLFA